MASAPVEDLFGTPPPAQPRPVVVVPHQAPVKGQPDGLFDLTPEVTRALAGQRDTPTKDVLPPLPAGVIRVALPPWDRAWEVKRRRGGWPVVDPRTKRVRKHRPVWDALAGNSRVHYTQRHKATKEVITAVVAAAVMAGLRPCRYMDVTLVWAPGHNRATDEDNRWPLLKACCDALARGPRKDLPGLHLLPDDDSRHMRKTVRIDLPPVSAGLWLEVVCRDEPPDPR